MTASRQRAARWVLALLLPGAELGAAGCNLYEGRSLDLFPPPDLLVECREARDCPRDRALCARGSCVQCLLDSDCDRRHPACVGNACVECRSAVDCSPEQSCNSVLNLCAPACTDDSGCSGPMTLHCSNELDLCVQCLDDTHCTGPRDPVCGPGGRCVACLNDANCMPDAGRSSCQLENQRCVECTSDDQCGAEQTCDLPAARCSPMPMLGPPREPLRPGLSPAPAMMSRP